MAFCARNYKASFSRSLPEKPRVSSIQTNTTLFFLRAQLSAAHAEVTSALADAEKQRSELFAAHELIASARVSVHNLRAQLASCTSATSLVSQGPKTLSEFLRKQQPGDEHYYGENAASFIVRDACITYLSSTSPVKPWVHLQANSETIFKNVTASLSSLCGNLPCIGDSFMYMYNTIFDVERERTKNIAYISGTTLLLDHAVVGYQYGHSISRFIQAFSIVKTSNNMINQIYVVRAVRPPSSGMKSYGLDETNLASIYNMSVASLGIPIIFKNVKDDEPFCARKLLYFSSYETPFFSRYQAELWRKTAEAAYGLRALHTCPSIGRAVILHRSQDNDRPRGISNEGVVDAVAASFGIPHVERLVLGASNTMRETAHFFSTTTLLISTHSSQLKGLFFASAHTAVIEVSGAHLGEDWARSHFQEGVEHLDVYYVISRNNWANCSAIDCSTGVKDRDARLTADEEKLRVAFSDVMRLQRTACPYLHYS